MIYTFIRKKEYDTFYSDIALNISYAQKFDFFDKGNLCATLLDYQGKAFALFRNEQPFTSRRTPFYVSECHFNMYDQDEKLFAKCRKKFRLFRSDLFTIEIPESGKLFYLRFQNKSSKETGYYKNIEYWEENEYTPACVIHAEPRMKSNTFLESLKPAPFEGTIEVADNLPRHYLFPFMLMLNRYEHYRKP